MLINLKEILAQAERGGYAVGAFNTPNMEAAVAVLQAAEELDVPVILMHAEVHEELMPLSLIGPVMVQLAKAAKVPVCVHLDHGNSFPILEQALALGFTSVMYDGSALPYEENLRNTQTVVGMAHRVNASVEAELGRILRPETGGEAEDAEDEEDPAAYYTDPTVAKAFVEETGIDALAIAFGTAHGLYTKAPHLHFPIIDQVKAQTGVPLVMHGGSGVSADGFRTAITKGIRKINYYTYMAKAGGKAVQELVTRGGEVQFFHDMVIAATQAMKADALQAMRIFYGH